jgi:hypothetical protein
MHQFNNLQVRGNNKLSVKIRRIGTISTNSIIIWLILPCPLCASVRRSYGNLYIFQTWFLSLIKIIKKDKSISNFHQQTNSSRLYIDKIGIKRGCLSAKNFLSSMENLCLPNDFICCRSSLFCALVFNVSKNT